MILIKNNLRIILAGIVFSLIFGGSAANVVAQIKIGGYKKIAASDAGVVAAAKFAAQNQGEKDGVEINLQSIETAEIQTVAGTNYKLCVEVFRSEAEGDTEFKQFVQTVVFRSLKKEFTLKSWEETEGCDEQK